MPGTHSILSPSSAKRWSVCTASVRATAECGVTDRTSPDAELGTLMHDLAEQVLLGKITRDQVPEEYAHILVYTDYCETLKKRWGGVRAVETRLPLFYLPEDHGTVDFSLISDSGLFIVDYKNGVGEPVDAEDNPQMAIYAQSLIEAPENSLSWEFPDEMPVEMVIIQPRYQGAEPIKIWQTTVKELREFCEHYRVTAELISKAEAGLQKAQAQMKFVPSYDTCRWCLVKKAPGGCAARNAAVVEPLSPDTDFLAELEVVEDEPLSLALATGLTDRQRLAVVTNAKLIKSWVDEQVASVMADAIEGRQLPGTKLVRGREGNRKWGDENEVMKLVTEAGLPISEAGEWKMHSPKKIEDAFKEAKIKPPAVLKTLTVRSEGKPVLALESDKRPALLDLTSLLDELTEETENDG